MQLSPEQKHLEQIFHPYAAEQQAAAFDRQIRFVHYTRAETAMSILKSKQIWMRKSMCMNDFMEVQYGLNHLFETYHRSDVGNKFKSLLDYLFKGLRTEIESLFDSWTWHLRTDTYFTCVSEHKPEEDPFGRLSMWRAYGGMSGVAIVMNNTPFQDSTPSDVLKIYGSPVAYFEGKKFVKKFGEAVNSIESEADLLRHRDRNEIKARIFKMLAFGAVCTKHPGFGEEVEWRVIHFPWWENSAHLNKEIEVVQSVPQPVYKIPLIDIPEKGLHGMTIPSLIDHIIIGPTRDPLAMREAFISLLDEAGVEQPGRASLFG